MFLLFVQLAIKNSRNY